MSEASPLLGPQCGFHAGRIQPSGYTPQDGSYALVLGSDIAGQYADLDTGDFIHFRQDLDLTGVTLLTFAVRVRMPSADPSGLGFQVRVAVGGSIWWDASVDPGSAIEYVTRTLNVSHLTGAQYVIASLQVI